MTKEIREQLRKDNPAIADLFDTIERDLRWEGRKKGCEWSAKWLEQMAGGKSQEIQEFAATVAMSIRACVAGENFESN